MPIPPAQTEDDLVQLWAKVVDPSYARPIIAADSVGEDVSRMQAVQFSAVDFGQMVSTQAYYLLPHSDQLAPPSSGEAYATTTLLVSRLGTVEGEATLAQGTPFQAYQTSSLGTQLDFGEYVSTQDVVFPAGERGPLPVPVRYEVPGTSGNQQAGSVSSFVDFSTSTIDVDVMSTTTLRDVPTALGLRDQFTEDMVGRFLVFPELAPPLNVGTYPRRIVSVTVGATSGLPGTAIIDPPLPVALVGQRFTVTIPKLDDLFTVEMPDAAVGGLDATLDAIGAERNTPRAAGETDERYRERLSNLADTISPGAIMRICERILGDCPWKFIETRGPGLTGFFYGDEPLTGNIPQTAWDYGDLISDGSVWAPVSWYFAIIVGPCSINPLGLAFDALNPPVPNAWDWAEAAYDMLDWDYLALINALWNEINAARAAGVGFEIIYDPDLTD